MIKLSFNNFNIILTLKKTYFISSKEETCGSNNECSKQNSCIDGICSNPCDNPKSNPCNANQECQVLDHQPVCIKGTNIINRNLFKILKS